MVAFLQAVILSIVQGMTEWFAISSSGHLAIFKAILGVADKDFLGLVIYLHFASVLGVIIYFWKDIIHLFTGKQGKYILKLIISLIPVALVGFFLKSQVENAFTSLFFIGIFFIICSFFIYSTKRARERKEHPSISDSLIIGVSQILALFPGISRSGMATGSGLIVGLKKEEAIKFSFLLAIPIVFGAAIADAGQITKLTIPYYTLITAFTLTLFTSLLTIWLLVKIVRSNKFYLFGIYNFVIGIILVLWSILK